MRTLGALTFAQVFGVEGMHRRCEQLNNSANLGGERSDTTSALSHLQIKKLKNKTGPALGGPYLVPDCARRSPPARFGSEKSQGGLLTAADLRLDCQRVA